MSPVQVDPFHERVTPKLPTTLHWVVLGQSMASNWPVVPLVSAVHVVPFQVKIVPLSPTALHSVAEGQEMALRFCVVPLVSLLHVVPFQERIAPVKPTILHSVADGHAMSVNKTPPAPVDAAVQLVPPHDNASPELAMALHVLGDEQLTRWMGPSNATSVVVSLAQLEPFQRVILPVVPAALHIEPVAQLTPYSGRLMPLVSLLQVAPFHPPASPLSPATLHCVADTQLTPRRVANDVVSVLHAVPFQETMAPNRPTALHALAVGQLTAYSWLVAPGKVSVLQLVPFHDSAMPLATRTPS
jgi:hypothetical protein